MSQKSKYENANPLHQYLLNKFLWSATRAVVSTGGKEIADIGCADGYFYAFLREHLGVDFKYAGYDVDASAIALARSRFPEVQFIQASLEDLHPVTSVVLCLQVLEHLADPRLAVEKLSLMQSEYFIISVPHEPWFRLGNLARGRHITALGNLPGHLNHWNKRGFSKLLSPHFKIVEDFSSFPWIIHLVRKRHSTQAN